MIYLLFLLLLVPVSAGAGEPTQEQLGQLIVNVARANTAESGIVFVRSTKEEVPGPDYKVVMTQEYSFDKEHWITAHKLVGETDCLATMEQAMRAMEPFLDGTRHINRPMTETQKDAYFKDRVAVYALWAEAKRCWREKP